MYGKFSLGVNFNWLVRIQGPTRGTRNLKWTTYQFHGIENNIAKWLINEKSLLIFICKCNWFYSNALLENNCSKALKDPGEQDWLESRWSNKGRKSIEMLVWTWSIFPTVSGVLPGCLRLLYTVNQSTHFSKILRRKRMISTASSENTPSRVSFCVGKKWFWFPGKSHRRNERQRQRKTPITECKPFRWDPHLRKKPLNSKSHQIEN